jgi:hypothetical protein
MKQGPRDILHGLSCLLVSLSGGNSRTLNLLQGKMAASAVPVLSIPRFVEVPDASLTSPDSNGMNSANSPQDLEYESPSSEWNAPMHQSNESSDSTVSSDIQHVPPNALEPYSVSTPPGMKYTTIRTPLTSWTFSV